MKRSIPLLAGLFVTALAGATPARAEVQGAGALSWLNSWLVQIGNASGNFTPANPLSTLDSNNSAFHGARVLIPSGTAGQPGTIAGSPYPSTAGGTAASATNTGYSFSWLCTTAGVGTITTTDGSILPFNFFANGGGISRDAYAIIDVEPGTASGCTFAVLR